MSTKQKRFGFTEVLLKYVEDKDATFTSSSTNNSNIIVECEILARGAGTSGFYKVGDKILVHKEMLIERKHKYFSQEERMLDNEKQIICAVD